jgi:GNAT superfamily N-acetyltransferase
VNFTPLVTDLGRQSEHQRGSQAPGDFDSEIYAIYLLRAHQGRGTGAALYRAAVQWLAEQGFGGKSHSIVLQENGRCRARIESNRTRQTVARSQLWLVSLRLIEIATFDALAVSFACRL